MPYLYRYEAKRIQSWILSSDRLKELKGASECINALEQQAETLRMQWNGGRDSEVVVAAAGNGMYRFATLESLTAFASAWPLVVSAHAPGLPLVQAAVEFNEQQGDAMERLFDELGKAHRESPVAAAVPGPFVVRTGRTGAPAIRRGEQGELCDASIVQKLAHTRAAAGGKSLETRLSPGKDLVLQEDLHRWGCDYVGVVHADGNRMAQLFRDRSTNEVQRLSTELKRITLESAKAAVGNLVQVATPRRGALELPLRPIVVGGDDVTFIVDGRYALSFANRYLQTFETLCKESSLPALHGATASAGVALVKVGWPFHMAHDLAEDLCKDAKKASGDGKQSTLSFHRVTDSFVGSLGEIRDRSLCRDTDRLSWGGYTLTQLQQLFRVVSAMQKRAVPGGKLREWCRLAVSNPSAAGALWQRTVQIAEETPAHRRDWREFMDALHAIYGDDANGLWCKRGAGNNEQHTVLHDAIAWQMVSGGEPVLVEG